MKKLKKPITTSLPTAKIFLDDVEKIEEILIESCSSYNIIFNDPKLDSFCEIQRTRELFNESYSFYTIKLDEEYELDSIDEIKEIAEKQDFHNLRITLTKPYFILDFNHLDTHIYCDDDTLCIGIIERIKPIIQKRKICSQLSLYIFVFLLGILLFIIILIDILMNLYSDLISYIIMGTAILLSIISCKFIFFKEDSRKFIVFTTKKSNKKSNYFIENKDELITKLFFGIITTATGIFIGNKVIPFFTSLFNGQ
ncbi:hypothetical protein QUB70_15085 [Microcoleus sp. A003_D6]|uniref:hypothetical protein n=1 Tax=Microcoleus sp. A003_D6 TaxID=3055266 RepID=UPI002FD41F7C